MLCCPFRDKLFVCPDWNIFVLFCFCFYSLWQVESYSQSAVIVLLLSRKFFFFGVYMCIEITLYYYLFQGVCARALCAFTVLFTEISVLAVSSDKELHWWFSHNNITVSDDVQRILFNIDLDSFNLESIRSNHFGAFCLSVKFSFDKLCLVFLFSFR